MSTWFKKVGDAVAQDEMLCELETDKVSVEVPAPAAGTLSEILAKEGDTVQANGKLAVLAAGAGAVAATPAADAPAAPRQSQAMARISKMRPPPRKPWPRPGCRRTRLREPAGMAGS